MIETFQIWRNITNTVHILGYTTIQSNYAITAANDGSTPNRSRQ